MKHTWVVLRSVGLGALVTGGIISLVATAKLSDLVDENSERIRTLDSLVNIGRQETNAGRDSAVQAIVVNLDTIKVLLRSGY
jgi:hypothetical protein